MTMMASQITSLTVVYSTVYTDTDQRKHWSSASLAFVWGIHRDRWIPHAKGQLHGKCFHLMTSSRSPAIDRNRGPDILNIMACNKYLIKTTSLTFRTYMYPRKILCVTQFSQNWLHLVLHSSSIDQQGLFCEKIFNQNALENCVSKIMAIFFSLQCANIYITEANKTAVNYFFPKSP